MRIFPAIITIISSLTVALAAAPGASAAESGDGFFRPYIGLGLGMSESQTEQSHVVSVENDGLAYKAYAGVGLGDLLAVEMNYTQFSPETARMYQEFGSFSVSSAEELDVRNLGLSVVLGYDVTEHFRPFVRAGVHRWELKSDEVENSAGSALESYTASGTDGFYGLGAEFRLGTEGVMEQLALRLEVENFIFEGGDFNTYMYSAGLLYRF